jgi:protein-disulfide isomerase
VASGDVSYEYRDFVLPQHKPRSQWASEAALCAADQGKYWAYHGQLFTNQKEFTKDDLKGYAKAIGLDTKTFNSCLDNSKHTKEVNAMTSEAMKLNLEGTPSVFLNGKPVQYQDLQNLPALIQAELKK